MSDNEAAIVRQIERLDHPDVHLQDAILRQFSRRADEIRPVALDRISRVNARIRRALLRWLVEVSTAEITLPLMRYVFDEAEAGAGQSERAMAMALLLDRARKTETPEERGRLRAFAEDMCSDSNPEIRRLAVEILAYVGNLRSRTHLEPLLNDKDEEVRDSVRRVVDILAEATGIDDEPEQTAKELRRNLLHSAGPRRRHLIRRWRGHGQKSEIAVDILRTGKDLRREALQILIDEPHSQARPYLASMVLDDPRGELAPLALRLLARLGDTEKIEPRPDEIRAIRVALDADEVLSCAAACAAAGSLKLHQFARPLIRLSESRQMPVALEAARSLDGLLDHSHRELFLHLIEALRLNERRRLRHKKDRDCTAIVAHLLSAIRDVVSPTTIGVERLQRAVFDILRAGARHRSLRVTGLQVLLASTPTEGLETIRRWKDEEVGVLVDLLYDAEPQALRRIATLLWRGAPSRAHRLDEAAHQLWLSDAVDIADVVVPLLDRADTPKALELLSRLAEAEDLETARAAKDVLRKRRNECDVIDVEYVRRDDEN